MKKLVLLLCAAVMLFSFAACGGGAETPSPTPTPTTAPTPTPSPSPEPTLSEYELAKQEILEHVDEAYSGLTSAGAPMYFLASDGGEYVALVLENTDGERYIKFIGSAVIDEASGILTVTDDETGHTFGFTAEEQADGSYFLDCGNLGECYLEPDEPGTVVDSIVAAFQTMQDVTDETVTALSEQSIMDYLDIAYFGVTETGGVMYYLASSDGSFAALIIESADETSYIKFVGTTTVDENGVQAVYDNEKGYIFAFMAEDQGDGSYFLDCGELGTCYIEPGDTEEILEFLNATFTEMEDVTDAYMTSVAAGN